MHYGISGRFIIIYPIKKLVYYWYNNFTIRLYIFKVNKADGIKYPYKFGNTVYLSYKYMLYYERIMCLK